MTGVTFELTLQGAEAAAIRLGRIAALDFDDLAFAAGQLLESSTQARIHGAKTAPDGTAWPAWSEAHARTRRAHHSLLVEENDLLTSVQNYSRGRETRIGTPLVYGAIHQMGGQAGRGRKVSIPARPYLGLSEHDRRAIETLVHDEIRGQLS